LRGFRGLFKFQRFLV